MTHNLEMNSTEDPPQNRTPDIQEEEEKRDWKKGSRIHTTLVGCNVLLFSCALLTCVFTKDIPIFEKDFLIFLIFMMVLCISWMLFQMFFTWRNKDAVLYKDCQAGPIWMRAGIILFGIGSLIMTSLKIAYTAVYTDCTTPTKIMQPVMQALFIIVQTCFLWISCKHCVQIHVITTRCFLMVILMVNMTIWIIMVTEESTHHTTELELFFRRKAARMNNTFHYSRKCFLMVILMVNMTIWIITVTEESTHHTTELELFFRRKAARMNNTKDNDDDDGDEDLNRCGCSYKCAINKRVYSYLYPFNIEYNLFSAAMIYIMWKNVGRKIDENALFHHGLGPGVRQHIPLLGLFSGLAIVITGLVMFILYEVGRGNPQKLWVSLTAFYFFHLISLFLMCLANVVGIVIFQLDKRNMCNQKNPSRTLDTVLLVLATLGQYEISYFSLIAMVSIVPFSLMCGLTFSYSVLMIIQHFFQNALIIQGLHRLPPANLLNAHSGASSPVSVEHHDSIRRRSVPEKEKRLSLTSLPGNLRMSRRSTLVGSIKSHLKKRKTMKDVYLFLFLCNITFWILPAFGARVMFDSGLEVNFYGFSMWAIITNICLPFGIFYRMHSAASLLELYSTA